MNPQRRILPVLALLAGLAWMAAVLLVAANPKGLSLAGDLAYDRANRVHTLALLLLTLTAVLAYRTIRAEGLAGRRAATALVIGTVLMLAGNVISFWGALVAGQQSEQFWGGWVGWLTFLPGSLIMLGAFIGLARAARHWPEVDQGQRWAIGLVGVLLTVTTATWAVSPAVTLVPALLAAFALLTTGTAIAQAAGAAAPTGAPATSRVRRTAEPTG
jgi:hypothetical protein